MTTIKELFASDINRAIEEVTKVDQSDAEVIKAEIEEYVATKSIQDHLNGFLDHYASTPNRPHEGIAVWVSGFFGSGKSSFAKLLGLAIENRDIVGIGASKRFQAQLSDGRVKAHLVKISEQIPTVAVIFDVSTDRGIRSGNQTLTEIMYRQLLQSLGYATNLDLAELEINLESQGRLEDFHGAYREKHSREWVQDRNLPAFAIGRASAAMHVLEPGTYPDVRAWQASAIGQADITPGKLAERTRELVQRRHPGKSLIYVIDEVGQFISRDVQKMLDLQAVIQSLGVRGRGRDWIVVTSQERLNEMVSGLDDHRIELARLMDRFKTQVHLAQEDIAEVTSKRVLSKNASAQAQLGALFEAHRGALESASRIEAEITLPQLTREAFTSLYPLLPYQIELVIQVVSGLRTQEGATKHVGGANRTIIKLAQQLLINPATNLASQPVGTLVTLDKVYDLVSGNIDSETRARIATIASEVPVPFAEAVAKSICLLQYVKTVPVTAENLAAGLYPRVGADPVTAEVRAALVALVASQRVRVADGRYKLPSAVEESWERDRAAISPRPADENRLSQEALVALWTPQPTHALRATRTFRAGLTFNGRDLAVGDLPFNVVLSPAGSDHEAALADCRTRSQQQRDAAFWAVAVDAAVDRDRVEAFRSREIIQKKEREAGAANADLLASERGRLRTYEASFRDGLRRALVAGTVYYRGSERLPSDPNGDVTRAAGAILGEALPAVYDRYVEGAAKATDAVSAITALASAVNYQGLPPIFNALKLVSSSDGHTTFRLDGGPLAVVLARITERAQYGETPTGRALIDHFGAAPFGWEQDVVRLLVLTLLGAGSIDATASGSTIRALAAPNAANLVSNANIFKGASFRPRTAVDPLVLIQAADAFEATFGRHLNVIASADPIASDLRTEAARVEEDLQRYSSILHRRGLAGTEVLDIARDHLRGIARASANDAVAAFVGVHRPIKDGLDRLGQLRTRTSEQTWTALDDAFDALATDWDAIAKELGPDDPTRSTAEKLRDRLRWETFYDELPAIAVGVGVIRASYADLRETVLKACTETYRNALDALHGTPGWEVLSDDTRVRIDLELQHGADASRYGHGIAILRTERDACDARLKRAVAEVRRLIDGDTVVPVALGRYFSGGIANEEELEDALDAVREACMRVLAQGKKVVVA
ncbi:MAG: BREX system P-loop protein BrxC [Chloroflexi bacterium]|nr:BREX system P-loop protein BrxC [Chloroflexota bacterium]